MGWSNIYSDGRDWATRFQGGVDGAWSNPTSCWRFWTTKIGVSRRLMRSRQVHMSGFRCCPLDDDSDGEKCWRSRRQLATAMEPVRHELPSARSLVPPVNSGVVKRLLPGQSRNRYGTYRRNLIRRYPTPASLVTSLGYASAGWAFARWTGVLLSIPVRLAFDATIGYPLWRFWPAYRRSVDKPSSWPRDARS